MPRKFGNEIRLPGMVDVVAHVHCHLGIYTSADMTSNCP